MKVEHEEELAMMHKDRTHGAVSLQSKRRAPLLQKQSLFSIFLLIKKADTFVPAFFVTSSFVQNDVVTMYGKSHALAS